MRIVVRNRAFISYILCIAVVLTSFTGIFAADKAIGSDIRLNKSSGTVTVRNASGKSQTVKTDMKLFSGYTVKTDAKSYAYITLDKTKAIKLDASTEVEIIKSSNKLEVYLSSGKIFFNVEEKLKSDESLNIRTNTMVTGIRGTSGEMSENKLILLTGKTYVNHIAKNETHIVEAKHIFIVYEKDITQTNESGSLNKPADSNITEEISEISIIPIEDIKSELSGFAEVYITETPSLAAELEEDYGKEAVGEIKEEAYDVLQQDEKLAEEEAKKEQEIIEKTAQTLEILQAGDGILELKEELSGNRATAVLEAPEVNEKKYSTGGGGGGSDPTPEPQPTPVLPYAIFLNEGTAEAQSLFFESLDEAIAESEKYPIEGRAGGASWTQYPRINLLGSDTLENLVLTSGHSLSVFGNLTVNGEISLGASDYPLESGTGAAKIFLPVAKEGKEFTNAAFTWKGVKLTDEISTNAGVIYASSEDADAGEMLVLFGARNKNISEQGSMVYSKPWLLFTGDKGEPYVFNLEKDFDFTAYFDGIQVGSSVEAIDLYANASFGGIDIPEDNPYSSFIRIMDSESSVNLMDESGKNIKYGFDESCDVQMINKGGENTPGTIFFNLKENKSTFMGGDICLNTDEFTFTNTEFRPYYGDPNTYRVNVEEGERVSFAGCHFKHDVLIANSGSSIIDSCYFEENSGIENSGNLTMQGLNTRFERAKLFNAEEGYIHNSGSILFEEGSFEHHGYIRNDGSIEITSASSFESFEGCKADGQGSMYIDVTVSCGAAFNPDCNEKLHIGDDMYTCTININSSAKAFTVDFSLSGESGRAELRSGRDAGSDYEEGQILIWNYNGEENSFNIGCVTMEELVSGKAVNISRLAIELTETPIYAVHLPRDIYIRNEDSVPTPIFTFWDQYSDEGIPVPEDRILYAEENGTIDFYTKCDGNYDVEYDFGPSVDKQNLEGVIYYELSGICSDITLSAIVRTGNSNGQLIDDYIGDILDDPCITMASMDISQNVNMSDIYIPEGKTLTVNCMSDLSISGENIGQLIFDGESKVYHEVYNDKLQDFVNFGIIDVKTNLQALEGFVNSGTLNILTGSGFTYYDNSTNSGIINLNGNLSILAGNLFNEQGAIIAVGTCGAIGLGEKSEITGAGMLSFDVMIDEAGIPFTVSPTSVTIGQYAELIIEDYTSPYSITVMAGGSFDSVENRVEISGGAMYVWGNLKADNENESTNAVICLRDGKLYFVVTGFSNISYYEGLSRKIGPVQVIVSPWVSKD